MVPYSFSYILLYREFLTLKLGKCPSYRNFVADGFRYLRWVLVLDVVRVGAYEIPIGWAVGRAEGRKFL